MFIADDEPGYEDSLMDLCLGAISELSHLIPIFIPSVQSMVRCLHQRGESALRKRQRGDQWSGIGGTEPILEDLGGNSELLSFDVHNFSILCTSLHILH